MFSAILGGDEFLSYLLLLENAPVGESLWNHPNRKWREEQKITDFLEGNSGNDIGL